MKCILTLIACTALAPLSRAFQIPLQPPRADPVLPYPTSGPNAVSGTATQVCVGQFTDDVLPDGALLCGNTIYLMYAPERFSSFAAVSGTYTAMTKVGLSNGKDGLIASTSSGLSLVQWTSSPRGLSASTITGSSGWDSATQIQVVTYSTAPTTRICALASNGKTILFAGFDGTALTDAGSITPTTNTIQALVGLNWGHSTDDTLRIDLAYDDGTGLQVVYPTGAAAPAPPFDTLYSCSNACLHPQLLRLPGSPSDGVIWITQNPSGGEMLTVARNGAALEPAVYFGTAMTAASMALADMTGDHLQDLVITESNDHYAWVLTRQSSGSMSFGASLQYLDLGTVYGTSCPNTPVFAAGDLDGDGDEDLLLAGQPSCSNKAYVRFAGGIDDENVNPYANIKAWISGRLHWTNWASAPASITFSLWQTPTSLSSLNDLYLHVTTWALDTAGQITPMRLSDECVNFRNLTPPYNVYIDEPTTLPDNIAVCFNYVEGNGTTAGITRSYPSWIGKIVCSTDGGGDGGADDGGDTGTDTGGTTTGGIDRPPPPRSSPVPTP
jgi:hypothetical protein